MFEISFYLINLFFDGTWSKSHANKAGLLDMHDGIKQILLKLSLSINF
jgi:hypothetical protein